MVPSARENGQTWVGEVRFDLNDLRGDDVLGDEWVLRNALFNLAAVKAGSENGASKAWPDAADQHEYTVLDALLDPGLVARLVLGGCGLVVAEAQKDKKHRRTPVQE
ncbi:hypothetical protein ACQ856_29995 (plasmid) [Mycolicibacterium psychrotolerans]|uniref:hypothetical protein n=1 Tax=Mycolicibacterium psychrotolerans TaxID=216929 RepID=UPI003D663D98